MRYFNFFKLHILINTMPWNNNIINPEHECTVRVTIVILSLCLSVYLPTFILKLQESRQLLSDISVSTECEK